MAVQCFRKAYKVCPLMSLLIGMSLHAYSQASWLVEAGINRPFPLGPSSSQAFLLLSDKARPSITFGGRLQWQATPHVVLGLGASVLSNSFAASYHHHTSVVDVDHKSAYLLASPMFGLSLGQSGSFQLHCTPSLGVLIYGNQTTHAIVGDPGGGIYEDSTFKEKISPLLFYFGLQMQQSIEASETRDVTISEGVNIPLSYLTTVDTHTDNNASTLRPWVWSIKIGLLHKNPRAY